MPTLHFREDKPSHPLVEAQRAEMVGGVRWWIAPGALALVPFGLLVTFGCASGGHFRQIVAGATNPLLKILLGDYTYFVAADIVAIMWVAMWRRRWNRIRDLRTTPFSDRDFEELLTTGVLVPWKRGIIVLLTIDALMIVAALPLARYPYSSNEETAVLMMNLVTLPVMLAFHFAAVRLAFAMMAPAMLPGVTLWKFAVRTVLLQMVIVAGLTGLGVFLGLLLGSLAGRGGLGFLYLVLSMPTLLVVIAKWEIGTSFVAAFSSKLRAYLASDAER